jgi:hypothetical protein
LLTGFVFLPILGSLLKAYIDLGLAHVHKFRSAFSYQNLWS